MHIRMLSKTMSDVSVDGTSKQCNAVLYFTKRALGKEHDGELNGWSSKKPNAEVSGHQCHSIDDHPFLDRGNSRPCQSLGTN